MLLLEPTTYKSLSQPSPVCEFSIYLRLGFFLLFFQEQNIELREKVKNLTESEDDQQRALRALEQASVKMETEKIKQHTEAVRLS